MMTSIIRSAIGSVASVGFLKFLKENKFYIIGTDINELVAAKYYVDKLCIVPKAEFSSEMINEYKKIISKHNCKWIISGPENEISVLSEYVEEFSQLNASVFHSPSDTLKIITDKWNAFNFFKSLDFKVPLTFDLASDNYSAFLGNKYILKPKLGRGASGIYIDTRIENIEFYTKIINPKEYILQEFLTGEEYTVDTLHDLSGRLLNVVVRKRLKTDSGISVIGQTVRDERIFQIIEEVSQHLKFVGGNCFQFIFNNNSYYLTDINPRFGGGSILSLKASASFRNNLINILNKKDENLVYNSFDYEALMMFRYYEEIFES